MASEILLVTRRNDDSKWAFTHEEDILAAIEITFSGVVHVTEKQDRDTYVVKVDNEDVINTDVFVVQRVPLLEKPDHL